jgi:isoquinoline 1-oxidoreductase alpha subunit
LLTASPHPDEKTIDDSIGGHICRCGTYLRIRKAIHRAAAG